MKKVLIGIVAIVALLALFSGCGYNSLVKLDEKVELQWNNVETQYQRRMDLIDQMVSTVKGAAKFEQNTLTAVIEARSKASQIKLDVKDLTPENIAKYQASQGQLNQALSRLMMLTENYPDLKATQQFKDLNVAIEGTENRIAAARRDFNIAVQEYNIKVRTFPNNMTAGFFGFSKKSGFSSDPEAAKAPKVEF